MRVMDRRDGRVELRGIDAGARCGSTCHGRLRRAAVALH